MSEARYSLPAVALHWLQAALIAGLFVLGWTMVDLPKGADRSAAYALHKSLGLSALLLTVARIAWRRRHPPPPAFTAGWEASLAAASHRLLYCLLLLAPAAGYLTAAFTAYPMKFFGLPLPKAAPDAALNAAFKLAHEASVWLLASLAVLHGLAALYHLLVRRDRIFLRMLPGRDC